MKSDFDLARYWASFERTASGIYGPLKPEDGFAESAVAAAAERLHLRGGLPVVLREFYLLAAARRNDYNVKELCCALAPGDLSVHEDSVLVFADNRPDENVSWSYFE